MNINKKILINLILITLVIVAFFLIQFETIQKCKTNGIAKNYYTELEENFLEINKSDVENGIATISEDDIEFEIKTANAYSTPTDTPMLVYGDGKTVKTATGSVMSFAYWDAVVVSYVDNAYVVTDVLTTRGEAKNTIAIPTGGFVILFYYEYSSIPSNLSVGTYIIPNFDYKTVSGRNLTGKTMTSTNTKPEPPSTEFKKPDRNNNLDLITNNISTSDFMKINLYDYSYIDANNHINSKYEADSKYPGFQNSNGLESFSNTKWGYGFDTNIVTDLKAGKNGLVKPETNLPITINTLIDGDTPLGYKYNVIQKKLGADGFPALSDGTSLGYLFGNGNESYIKKINTKNLDGLFQYDDAHEMYWYDSRKNHAEYNKANDNFDLYNQVITANFMTYPFGSFLPFNSIKFAKQCSAIDNNYWNEIINSAKNKADKETDSAYKKAYTGLSNALTQFLSYGNRTGLNCINSYFEKSINVKNAFNDRVDELNNLYTIDFDDLKDYYFGLSVSLKFVSSEDGWCTKDNSPREFFFVGDDDVWIYIDDELFVDLSGIHRHVGAKINFHEGKVYYYKHKSLLNGDCDTSNPIKIVNFSDIIEDKSQLTDKGTLKPNTAHKIDLFYMERGSGSSMCSIRFNLKRNHIEGTKIWKEDLEKDRPEEVTIHLLQNGKRYATTTTNAEKDWKYSFEDIPFFAPDGTAHKYTVEEEPLPNYEVEYYRENDDSRVIDIINTYKYKNLTVNKVWDDMNSENRPKEIKVQLSATLDGEAYTIEESVPQIVTLNSENNWQYTWNQLMTNNEGKTIEYSVKELDLPEGYISNVTLDNNIYTITNTKYRTITVNKYEKNNYDKKISGAEFKLEKLTEENGNWIVDSSFGEKTGITSTEPDKLGQLVFEELTYGKYRLTETKAPDGYKLLKEPVEIDVTSEKLNFNVDIENRKNIILPNTGGNIKAFMIIFGTIMAYSMYIKFNKTQIWINRSNLRILKNYKKNNRKKSKRKPRISM